MPGEKPKLTPLETRKQLLLVESDLNRARFIEAVRDWKAEFHQTKERLTRVGSIASAAVKVATVVSGARRLFSRPEASGKKSWLSILLDGMATGTSLWSMMNSHRRKQDD